MHPLPSTRAVAWPMLSSFHAKVGSSGVCKTRNNLTFSFISYLCHVYRSITNPPYSEKACWSFITPNVDLISGCEGKIFFDILANTGLLQKHLWHTLKTVKKMPILLIEVSLGKWGYKGTDLYKYINISINLCYDLGHHINHQELECGGQRCNRNTIWTGALRFWVSRHKSVLKSAKW